MSLADDLAAEVSRTFSGQWAERDGQKIPEAEDLGLGNEAVKLEGTVLYADLAESTNLVDSYPAHFPAEIYKSYLRCAARIIRNNSGEITAYDGDRIMAVFIGAYKNSSAAKAALQINYAVREIVNPRLRSQYPKLAGSFQVRQAVGIDTSDLFIARTEIRGSNDLVWVGRAANHAAKLSGLREGSYSSWITSEVYKKLHKNSRIGEDGLDMWEQRYWRSLDRTVYRSSYWWQP